MNSGAKATAPKSRRHPTDCRLWIRTFCWGTSCAGLASCWNTRRRRRRSGSGACGPPSWCSEARACARTPRAGRSLVSRGPDLRPDRVRARRRTHAEPRTSRQRRRDRGRPRVDGSGEPRRPRRRRPVHRLQHRASARAAAEPVLDARADLSVSTTSPCARCTSRCGRMRSSSFQADLELSTSCSRSSPEADRQGPADPDRACRRGLLARGGQFRAAARDGHGVRGGPADIRVRRRRGERLGHPGTAGSDISAAVPRRASSGSGWAAFAVWRTDLDVIDGDLPCPTLLLTKERQLVSEANLTGRTPSTS